jgi:folylpolyglutamate synthase/dihydropteroate synthase
MIRILAGPDTEIIAVRIAHPHGVPQDLPAAAAAAYGPAVAFDSSREGLAYARDRAAPEDVLVVTGSFYLVSELRRDCQRFCENGRTGKRNPGETLK